MTTKVKLFISYSHEDRKFFQELMKQLGILRQENVIEAWSDRDIPVGRPWREEISSALDTADVILLLISSGFIGSDFCYGTEMKRAFERHRDGSARVIPIAIGRCHWGSAPFATLQGLPEGLTPISSLSKAKRDDAYTEVVAAIDREVQAIAKRKAQAKPEGAKKPDSAMRSREDRLGELRRKLAVDLFKTSAIPDALNAACVRHEAPALVHGGEAGAEPVKRLMALPFRTCVAILQDARKALEAKSDSIGATAMRTAARHLIPWLFVASQGVSDTQSSWERIGDGGLIGLKAGHESFAEIFAAGLDIRDARFSGHVGEMNCWPKGSRNVNSLPPSGIQGDIDDVNNFRNHLWNLVRPPNFPGVPTEAQKDTAINGQLEDFAKKEGIRYYMILNDGSWRDAEAAARWGRSISDRYPALASTVLDPDLYDIHRNLFNDLRELLSE